MDNNKKSKKGYGLTVEPCNVVKFIKHCLKSNIEAEEKGRAKTPTCI